MATYLDEALTNLASALELLLPLEPENGQLERAEGFIEQAISLIKEHINANSSPN